MLWVAAMVVLVVALLGLYAGGYYWLGEMSIVSGMHDTVVNGQRVWVEDPPRLYRSYRYRALAILFEPAAWLESHCKRMEVEVSSAIP
jgi:hypothetical protein